MKKPYILSSSVYVVNIEGKHIKSQYRQPTNKWYIMKIYYMACPRKRATDLNVIQINITLIERRHRVPGIVKFITELMRTFACMCVGKYNPALVYTKSMSYIKINGASFNGV